MDTIVTQTPCPVVSFIGHKNMGKTTLIMELITYWTKRGYRIAALKHTHHGFQMDHESTDSHKFHLSGAVAVGVVGSSRVAYLERLEHSWEAENILNRYFHGCQLDFLLLEGFKSRSLPKIEVYNPDATEKSPLGLPETLAVVATRNNLSDRNTVKCPVLRFDAAEVATFIEKSRDLNELYLTQASVDP